MNLLPARYTVNLWANKNELKLSNEEARLPFFCSSRLLNGKKKCLMNDSFITDPIAHMRKAPLHVNRWTRQCSFIVIFCSFPSQTPTKSNLGFGLREHASQEDVKAYKYMFEKKRKEERLAVEKGFQD